MAADVAAAQQVSAETEWWQRWVARRDAFVAAQPVAFRVLAVGRAVLLWVALAWLVVLLLWVPDLRPGMRAWAGCLWIVVAWFLLAPLKTLTWRGYARFFA